MSNCINSIKTINNLDIHSQDYYKTGLIGLKKTKVTTVLDNENLDNILNAKIITTHPNFAAFVVFPTFNIPWLFVVFANFVLSFFHRFKSTKSVTSALLLWFTRF